MKLRPKQQNNTLQFETVSSCYKAK